MEVSRKVSLVCCAALLLIEEEEEEEAWYAAHAKRPRKQRAEWVRPLFSEGRGFYETLRVQLQQNDPELYRNFLRMSADDFNFLLEKITPVIEKKNTNMCEPICAGERLAITLQFLATGDSYSSLMFLFKRSKSSICHIVPEVCAAIHSILKDEFLKMPTTEEEWNGIAKVFNDRWNFPNCFGAIDGKHIDIIAPTNCGSEYFNYKQKNSIVLMALADGQYNFTFIDIGAKGRESDGGVYARCALSKALENNLLNLPRATPLHGLDPVPYVMVADDAFPLKPYIMKPFNYRNQNTQQRVFSYRLSRARRVVENVFGIAAARFRILRKPIEMTPGKVTTVVLAICTLHNFLMKRKSVYTTPNDFDQVHSDGSVTEGNWRREINQQEVLRPLESIRNEGRTNDHSKQVREEFTEYFMNEGDVPWQYKYIYNINE